MPVIPTNLPKPPPQVFALATPAHVLSKLYWEIKNLREHLLNSKAEWSSHLDASYMAFNVAVTAWHLCDWVWHSWLEKDQRRVMAELDPRAVINAGNFRGAMSQMCRELKICQQIANGSKHMRNDRADVAVKAELNWEIVQFQKSAAGSGEPKSAYDYNLVVWDRDNRRDAIDVFETTFQFWERQLRVCPKSLCI